MLVRSLTLMYHAVSDGWNDPLAVRTADFRRQLASLVARGYRGASAADVLARPGDRRLLHVTFDDAYASVTNAIGPMRELRIHSTIFVCTDFADEGRRLEIPELGRVADRDELRTLSWDELRELVRDELVEVGSHTKSHAHLPELSDAELDAELRQSREAIEDHLGARAPFLAYPFGEEDERVRRAAERAGYAGAFAAPGASFRTGPYRLPRTGLWRDEPPERQRTKTRYAVRIAAELNYPLRRYLKRRREG
ncbi:MAG TPA: polysaccharide deacetylase family protein [Gaiellaceae bacterium]|nr:polysaccharide deacetylase family protein [Gaiellaceae bacterium]